MSCRTGRNRRLSESKPDESKAQDGAPTSSPPLHAESRCCCEKPAEVAPKPVERARSGCDPCCE
jgi:hypothetical protein